MTKRSLDILYPEGVEWPTVAKRARLEWTPSEWILYSGVVDFGVDVDPYLALPTPPPTPPLPQDDDEEEEGEVIAQGTVAEPPLEEEARVSASDTPNVEAMPISLPPLPPERESFAIVFPAEIWSRLFKVCHAAAERDGVDAFWSQSFSSLSLLCKDAREQAAAFVYRKWDARCIDDEAESAAAEGGHYTRVSTDTYLRHHLGQFLAMHNKRGHGRTLEDVLGRLEPIQWSKPLVAFYALVARPSPPELPLVKRMDFGLYSWRHTYVTTLAPDGPLKRFLVAALADPADAKRHWEGVAPAPPFLVEIGGWEPPLEWMLVRLAWRGLPLSASSDSEAHALLMHLLFYGLMEDLAAGDDPLRLPIFLLSMALRMPMRPVLPTLADHVEVPVENLVKAEEEARIRLATCVGAMLRALVPENQGEAWVAVHGDETGLFEERRFSEHSSPEARLLLGASFARAVEAAGSPTRTTVAKAILRGGLARRMVTKMAARVHVLPPRPPPRLPTPATAATPLRTVIDLCSEEEEEGCMDLS